jgi:hypothetical protein
VKRDRRWWNSKQRILDAECIYDLAAGAVQSMEQRKDMIVTMGADRRVERQGELRLLEGKPMNGMEERLLGRKQIG